MCSAVTLHSPEAHATVTELCGLEQCVSRPLAGQQPFAALPTLRWVLLERLDLRWWAVWMPKGSDSQWMCRHPARKQAATHSPPNRAAAAAPDSPSTRAACTGGRWATAALCGAPSCVASRARCRFFSDRFSRSASACSTEPHLAAATASSCSKTQIMSHHVGLHKHVSQRSMTLREKVADLLPGI